MLVKSSQKNGIMILTLSGKIMGGPDATVLNDKLHELLDSGNKKIIIDLAGVDWMNSSGLGILISSLTTIRNAGGDLKLVALTEKIKTLLTITKLLTVLESYDTVEEAIDQFAL
jgi:anti-sigma B factor antagonist